MGALHGWHWAKALYLQSLLGEPSAREKSLRVFGDAIRRGGRSSWFNRMRASLNRESVPALAEESARMIMRLSSYGPLMTDWKTWGKWEIGSNGGVVPLHLTCNLKVTRSI